MKSQYETGPWGELVRAASHERDVVTVVRQLLFSVDPEDMKDLPAECREVSVTDVESLGAWALTLTRVELLAAQPNGQPELLRVISQVLTCAQAQVATLRIAKAPARYR